MIGLSQFMLNLVTRDTTSAFESAVGHYTRRLDGPPAAVGDPSSAFTAAEGARLAARAAVLGALSLRALRGAHGARDAATLLQRASVDETALGSALLLDEAARNFLSCPRPMLRKYAFTVMMAGRQYLKCEQRVHGVRCYLEGVGVYEGEGWGGVEVRACTLPRRVQPLLPHSSPTCRTTCMPR